MGGPPRPWGVGDVIGNGWEAVKRWWVVLILAPFLAAFIGGIPGQIPQIFVSSGAVDPGSDGFFAMTAICTFISVVVSIFFQVGQLRIYLAAARGQEPEFMTIFSGADRFLPVLLLSMLLGLIIAAGMMMLLVPGIILSLGLGMATMFCVDQRMGVIDSLKASWDATNGHKLDLFGFAFAVIGVMLLGLLACCLGIYVAIPVIGVAYAIIYLHLTGQPTGGGGGGYVPPQGGFGGPPQGGFGGPPQGGFGGPPQGGFGGPPQGGPPQGGFGGPPQGGFGGPPQGGGGYGPPPGGGAPPAGGGGYGPPPGGGGPPQGGGGYGPPPGGGGPPQGGFGGPQGGGGGGYGPPPGG